MPIAIWPLNVPLFFLICGCVLLCTAGKAPPFRASLWLGVAPGPDPAVECQQGLLGALGSPQTPITSVIRGVGPPVLLFTYVLCKPVRSQTATCVSVAPRETLESWYHSPSLEGECKPSTRNTCDSKRLLPRPWARSRCVLPVRGGARVLGGEDRLQGSRDFPGLCEEGRELTGPDSSRLKDGCRAGSTKDPGLSRRRADAGRL